MSEAAGTTTRREQVLRNPTHRKKARRGYTLFTEGVNQLVFWSFSQIIINKTLALITI